MRTALRVSACVILAAVFLSALLAGWIAPHPYEKQFRESPGAPPSGRFPLGTDELGRDRLSRLLFGTRVSLLLAPAAALLAVAGAALVGGLAGAAGRRLDGLLSSATDLTLSLPWLFLLVGVRAALPLDLEPWISATVTFALLGLLGWAGPARVVRAAVAAGLESDYARHARSLGLARGRVLFRHVLPNMRPILAAQFWVSVPVFILAEANLGMLGLGVSEPLPSWGALLKELETQAGDWRLLIDQYWLLAPVALLLAVVMGLRMVFPAEVSQ